MRIKDELNNLGLEHENLHRLIRLQDTAAPACCDNALMPFVVVIIYVNAK